MIMLRQWALAAAIVGIMTIMLGTLVIADAPPESRIDRGHGLLEFCDADPEGALGSQAQILACLSYLWGFNEGKELADTITKHDLPDYCAPTHMSVEQMRLIVVKFLKNHPELLHELSAGLVAIALTEAFPCD